MKQTFIILILILTVNAPSFAQCCSGGSGSPIAGGASQGVEPQHQFELNTNFQFINTNKFFTGDIPDTNKYFDSFSSAYQYFRLAYGVTDKLTMSLEAGYYFYKEEVGLNNDPSRTYNSQGFSDLIIFPRYNILSSMKNDHTTDVTVGLGYKIPVGSYNDSTGNVEPFSGETYYITNPQAVQLTSGAQDIIFYAFFLRAYPIKSLRFFANALYIKKGWNPLGEKMGDFASIGLFAGKTFFDKLAATLQVRGEITGKMSLNENILLYAYPNYDPDATGYKKIFVSPMLNYTLGNFTFFAFADIPVYQNVTKTQVGTQFQATAGLSFRFYASKLKVAEVEMGDYYCPMHPEVKASFKGTCPKCGGMELIKKQ